MEKEFKISAFVIAYWKASAPADEASLLYALCALFVVTG